MNDRRKFIVKSSLALSSIPFMPFLKSDKLDRLSTTTTSKRKKVESIEDCEYQLLRHAAALFKYSGSTFLIDPMLNQQLTTVPLPLTTSELTDELNSIDAIILTHAHNDHINLDSWQINILKDKPFFCQSTNDRNVLASIGFTDTRIVGLQTSFNGIDISKTSGTHGTTTGWNVSGYVFSKTGNNTVYIAGDTIYSTPVENALNTHNPDVVIVNCGNLGPASDPWTMVEDDVLKVHQNSPDAEIIAVHMGAFTQSQSSRSDLRQYSISNSFSDSVHIPEDGEAINLCKLTSIEDLTLDSDQIGAWPNPFYDKVQFDVPGKLSHIQISNSNGKIVQTIYSDVWDSKNANGVPVPSGLYIALIKTSKGTFLKKILKGSDY